MQLGTFKQLLLVSHNKVNQEVLGQGLTQQRVDLLEDRAVIMAVNRRLQSLRVLESYDGLSAKTLEAALILRLKEALKTEIEERLHIPVKAVFKDYDQGIEISMVVILFDGKIEELIRGIE